MTGREPKTGLGKASATIVRMVRWTWHHLRDVRPVTWHSNIVAVMIFIGAFGCADGIMVIFLESQPWYLKWPVYMSLILAVHRFSPDSKRIKDAGDKRPASWTIVKTLLGTIIITLSTIVRFTILPATVGAFSIVLCSALVVSAYALLPLAVRNIREDLVKAVLEA